MQTEHIAKWWGPNGFTNTITKKWRCIPGGEWNLVMHGLNGINYPNKNIFREVILYKKIVYEHVSSPKFIATIQFEEMGGQTSISWHLLFETAEEFIRTVKTFKANEGLKQNLVKLNEYVRDLSR